MSRLETAISPIVGKMGGGDHATLDVEQQWTIARWAIAKAMVWEHVSSHKIVFYTDDERFALRDGTLPPSSVVWLSAHGGRETFFAMGADASSHPGVTPQLQAYFTTFAIDRLVIQVMSVRPPELADAYSEIDCKQRVWADALIRIWPTVHVGFWPPLLAMDDAMLERFHKRCGSHPDESSTPPGPSGASGQ